MTDLFFVSVKRVTDVKHAVLTLAKIKHRTPETRLNPYLIYLSRLEKMRVELTDAIWTHVAVAVVSTYFELNIV